MKYVTILNPPRSNMGVITVMQVPVAQWIARWTSNPEVVGSNPTGDDGLILLTVQLQTKYKEIL